jgi:Tol biopolymer transport system component
MSWPSSSPNQARRSRRPKPPPLTLRQKQRRNRRRVLLRILGVMIGAVFLPLVLAVSVVVVVGRADRPADVPDNFQAPTALPRAAAPLPPDQLLYASDRGGTFGIYTMDTGGQSSRPILQDPEIQSWGPRLSPDRLTAIFYRSPAGAADRDPSEANLWAVASDGSGAPVELRPAGLDGWVVQNHAEWDQYGTFLIMSGGSRSNPQIFRTNALGQNPEQLTNRPGINTDPSYTPNGREIFFIGCPTEACEQTDRDIYRMPAGGGEPVRVTSDKRADREPYVSVGEDRLMWLSRGTVAGDGWQIRVADRAGDVIDNPRSILPLAGEEVVGRPQWSNDGATIYVHMKPAGRATTGIFAISTNSPRGPVEITLGQAGNHEDPSL